MLLSILNSYFARSYLAVAFTAFLALAGCTTSQIDVNDLRHRAESGDVQAQFQLGAAYDFGHDVAVDRTEAAKWYRIAAEKGNAAAQNSLGSLYQNGQGVACDYKLARAWYEKSAAQGYTPALNSLGYLYDFGLGVETNAQRAVELYRQAAEKGDPYAMLNLGVSAEDGSGVPKDLVEAYKWFDLALFYTLYPQFSSDKVLRGRSRRSLDRVATKMTQKQIAEAKELSHEWDQQHSKHLFYR